MAHTNQQNPFEGNEDFLAKFEQKARDRRLDLNAVLSGRETIEPPKDVREEPQTDVKWSSLSREQRLQLLSRSQDPSMFLFFPNQNIER